MAKQATGKAVTRRLSKAEPEPRMGRPSLGEERKIPVQVMLKPDEADALRAWAAKNGKTVSVLGREFILEGMERKRR